MDHCRPRKLRRAGIEYSSAEVEAREVVCLWPSNKRPIEGGPVGDAPMISGCGCRALGAG
jgi:hypothetical protein